MKTALLVATAAGFAVLTAHAHMESESGPRHAVVHDDHALIVTNLDGAALVMGAGSCLIGPALIGSNQGRPILELAAGVSYPPGCSHSR